MPPPVSPSLPGRLAGLGDPRQAAELPYLLPEIHLLRGATLVRADGLAERQARAAKQLGRPWRLRPCRRSVSSHDTRSGVISALGRGLRKACFVSWVEGWREREPDLLAIDGRPSRRSHARSKGCEPLHLVSALASRRLPVLGPQPVSGRPSEITAIPLLPERLALRGVLITIDAIGSRGEIATAIPERGGDHLPGLVASQPTAFKDVPIFFADPPPDSTRTCTTANGDQGRIKARHHAACPWVAWLLSARRYPGEPAFPGHATIGTVAAESHGERRLTRERRSSPCSARLGAATFAQAVRGPRSIESRLRRALEMVPKADLAQLRTGHGPENKAVVRRMATGLLRRAKPASLRSRRKRASWSRGWLESLVRQTA